MIAARRTPIGTAGRSLARVPLHNLAAPVLRTLCADVRRAGLPVDEVILGNCMGPGGNPARVAALAIGGGLGLTPGPGRAGPDSEPDRAPASGLAGAPASGLGGGRGGVTGLTVDRQCGSGLEAITLAAALVEAGRASLVLAGGAESASTAPIRAWQPTEPGARPVVYSRAPFAPEPYADPDMGVAADDVARTRGIGRARQDEYAARSHARAVAAYEAKRYEPELVPVEAVVKDDRPRPGMTAGRLGRLPPAFVPASEGGTVSAGNSCGINDGAAAVAVVPEQVRAALGVPGLRIVDWECAGCDPALPGLGPVPAVSNLLRRQGIGLEDVGVIEFVEAFAAQVLACADALGLDPERICPDGGALALGHPWGATGAVLVVRLFTQLVREQRLRPGGLGLAAAAIGGGMGLACLVEYVPGAHEPMGAGPGTREPMGAGPA